MEERQCNKNTSGTPYSEIKKRTTAIPRIKRLLYTSTINKTKMKYKEISKVLGYIFI